MLGINHAPVSIGKFKTVQESCGRSQRGPSIQTHTCRVHYPKNPNCILLIFVYVLGRHYRQTQQKGKKLVREIRYVDDEMKLHYLCEKSTNQLVNYCDVQ